MRRHLSIDKFRDVVRARITKGSAFMLSHTDYEANQEKVRLELASMTKEEMASKYDYACYDLS